MGKEVEKELGVEVERIDIMKDPAGEALLELLTQKKAPFLYNRESCQAIGLPTSSSDEAIAKQPLIEKERLRAWAKGRYVPPAKSSPSPNSNQVGTPKILS